MRLSSALLGFFAFYANKTNGSAKSSDVFDKSRESRAATPPQRLMDQKARGLQNYLPLLHTQRKGDFK